MEIRGHCIWMILNLLCRGSKNKDKWCTFQKEYKYDMEYYWDLNRILYGFANHGKLDKYLNNIAQKREHIQMKGVQKKMTLNLLL